MEARGHQHASDAELARAGSFDELVHRYAEPLYNFARRLTGNPQAAEDVVQDTFVKAWKNLKKYDSSYSFKSWIFTIARNTVTDHLRKKSSIPFSNLSGGEDDVAFEETISDPDPLPEEAVSRLENAQLLTELLDTLPPDQRTVLVLHYQESMTFDEIGRVMGKPLNTVKSHHRRAIEKLRTLASGEHAPK